MVRNICITGEEENVKTYNIYNGNISNVSYLCEKEDLINKSKETTNKLIQLILNSINSKKYSIRPFYIKYPDETLASIFSLNLVATIDDERYLVHISFSIKIIKFYYIPLISIFDYINKELSLLMSNQT